jgi:hypothetical protein
MSQDSEQELGTRCVVTEDLHEYNTPPRLVDAFVFPGLGSEQRMMVRPEKRRS